MPDYASRCLDSKKSSSSLIDGEVCAVGKGSASAYAEITGLSTALVCSGPDTVSVRRSHVHIKETSGAVAVGTARFAHAFTSVMPTSILATVSVQSRTASRGLRIAVRRHTGLPTIYF